MQVWTGAHVSRLLFESGQNNGSWDGQPRAVGVEVLPRGDRGDDNRGAPLEVRAKVEVILCAGSIGTPQLLQLSGIGAPQALGSLGRQYQHLAIKPYPARYEQVWPLRGGGEESSLSELVAATHLD